VQVPDAALTEVGGAMVARHFGDPATEYAAVRNTAGVAARSDLAPIRVWGRDPVRMMHGLVTNDITAVTPARGAYAAMLTPKGRTIAEMRVFRRSDPEAGLLLIVPREALAGAAAHLKKFVPPMFARWEDASAHTAILGVYGPRAAEVLSAVFGAHPLPEAEDATSEVELAAGSVLIAATANAHEPGFDLVLPASLADPVREQLLQAARQLGGGAVGFGALETLRVEAGRPRYGAELTEEVIPTEAFEAIGWIPRAISFTKGCYTGQEVIVRIAHRGHVNRHLRGLVLPDGPTPARGTPIFNPVTGKQGGWVTTAVVSPRLGVPIALAYVRREIEPGGTVRVGSAEGEEARVVNLPFAPATAG
jgi:tRNA-modifying protein YgfZ